MVAKGVTLTLPKMSAIAKYDTESEDRKGVVQDRIYQQSKAVSEQYTQLSIILG